LLGLAELERIEEGALRLLERVGIAVLDEGLLQWLRARGFRVDGNRFFVDPGRTGRFLDEERQRNGRAFPEGPLAPEAGAPKLSLSLNPYAQFVHDLETDRIVPFTMERLIEATKVVDVLHERGLCSSPPGCPTDMPAPVQPVAQYWVSATYSRQGRWPVDPKSLAAFPYVMEMAEILGHPLRHLPVYVFSPLTLGGESLTCALRFRDKVSSLHVCSMPSVGATAPVQVGDAFALAAAEVIGSALALREALELPVGWAVALFPCDFASMAMVFGSPEAELFQLASPEVDAYFHGTRWAPAGGTVHTMAKLPGAQACAEKAAVLAVNALLGQRTFTGAGALSLDEVFSAEQLLYDLEIKDHVEGLLSGLDADCVPERCVAEVTEALRRNSFAALESTAWACRAQWRPLLFERSFLASWRSAGAVTARQRTCAEVRRLLRRHEYELDPELQRALDDVFARAKHELA
jgi:trimethylamine:corrinoid methyltransferase-like protein